MKRLPLPRLIPLALVLIGSWGTPVHGAEEVPWRESFTMPMAGSERVFAMHEGTSYLVISPVDALDNTLLLGRKEVVLVAKFEKAGVTGHRLRLRLSNFPRMIAEGEASLFASRLEGDNLYLFGTVSTENPAAPYFQIVDLETAPSDEQIVARLTAGPKKDDYAGRLKAAEDIRQVANVQPNKEFWYSAADTVVMQVIDDASAAAGKNHDVALLNQAITWSIDVLHDPTRAGRVASVTWLRQVHTPAADAIGKRLRSLGLESYKDRWLPRSEALSLEFEDRFEAISWRDAESFFRLGRWADVNGEFLPQAKDRSHRCYQAGLRANPNHQGIRNQLGMPVASSGELRAAATQGDDYRHESGIVITAPQGWKRGDPVDGDMTWSDPISDTAYISASVIEVPMGADFDVPWNTVMARVRTKLDFTPLEESELAFAQGIARQLRYQIRDGKQQRSRVVILAVNPKSAFAVRLDASASDDEMPAVQQRLSSIYDHVVIPAAAAPSATKGTKP